MLVTILEKIKQKDASVCVLGQEEWVCHSHRFLPQKDYRFLA